MPAYLELHNVGDASFRSELAVAIDHMFADRPGDWTVSILGSRANHDWELKIQGPKEFERSYTLIASAGQHEPEAIRTLLLKLLPSST
jgi:hypothetical protein